MRKRQVVAEMLTIQVFQKYSLQVFLGIADKSQCDGFWHHVDHFTLNYRCQDCAGYRTTSRDLAYLDDGEVRHNKKLCGWH